MKYFFIIMSLVVSIIMAMLFFLFTQSGNNIIKPYIEQAIQKKLNKDVYIEAFTLKTDFIDAELVVDKNSKLILNGSFNLLKKSFDLDYIADAKNLQTPYVTINGALHVEGKAKGILNDFELSGKGIALNSKIDFRAQLDEKTLKGIKLKAKNIKIENILAFVKKPIYSRGMIDIDIDIKPKENNTYYGNSNIKIHYGTLNKQLLENDFGIKLDSIITYRGTIKSTANAKSIDTAIKIFSNIGNLQTKNTQYSLDKKVFYSDYVMKIPKLNSINKNLYGNITLDGNIQKDDSDFTMDINSKALGGVIKAIIFNDTLKVDAENIDIPQLTKMLKKPHYSDGKLNMTLDMQDTRAKSRDGKLDLNIEDGVLHVKEILDKKSTDTIKYIFSLSSDIIKNNASIESELLTVVAQLNIHDSTYSIDTGTTSGQYNFQIKDLNDLYFVTKRTLKGEFIADGNFLVNDNFYIDGNSSFLEADTKFELKNSLLHIKSDDLSIEKVTDMLYYPKIFDSFSTLEADYNLENKSGVVSINALNGKIIKNELTDIIQMASGFDLTTEVYKDSIFRGVIANNSVDFSLLMNGLESYFKIPDGYINLETNEIKSEFNIKIQDKDFQGSINGDLEKPKVELSGSEYLKQKIEQEIEKNIPLEWQDTAKSILDLFG